MVPVRILSVALVACCLNTALGADPTTESTKLTDNKQHFLLSSQPTGLLIPLYLYPADIHTNPEYNRLIELKLSHPRVPVCVIVNPASGPGESEDGNYKYAIRRLRGAGCVVLGYVSTHYATVPLDTVRADIQRWSKLYEGVNGIFLDEQTNDDNPQHLQYYVDACAAAHDAGYWPVFANPGTDQIERYFIEPTADVIVTFENDHDPTESVLRGDYFGGYADQAPHRRAALVHSQADLNPASLRRLARYTRWVYVTHDTYQPNAKPGSGNDNPWDSLSRHAEQMFEVLDR
jgi:hypothetical protein